VCVSRAIQAAAGERTEIGWNYIETIEKSGEQKRTGVPA